jgi:hypothetical protein
LFRVGHGGLRGALGAGGAAGLGGKDAAQAAGRFAGGAGCGRGGLEVCVAIGVDEADDASDAIFKVVNVLALRYQDLKQLFAVQLF